MTYQYQNPLQDGYRRVKLSQADHNRLFPSQPIHWAHRFEYYLKDTDFLLQRFVTREVVAMSIVLFPLSLLVYGIANFKAVWWEHARMVKQKKHGSFTSDKVWSTSDSFAEIVKAVKS